MILAGSNDIVLGDSAETTVPRVLALHEACERAGVPCVVVSNPDCDMDHHGMCTEPKRARAELRTLAGELSKRAVASGRALVDAQAELPLDPQMFDDSIHLSVRGSRKLAALIHNAMVRHGARVHGGVFQGAS